MSHIDKPECYNSILQYEVKDSIGWITLNRPQKLNAFNDQMIYELDEALAAAEPDLDAKVIVIKGAGRAFSVGEDLSGLGTDELMKLVPGRNATVKESMEAARRWNRRLEYIFNIAKPVVTQVHGYCLGFACSLAMVSDITIASEDAVFGDPTIRMGALPSNPVWPYLIGINRAKEVLYTGKYLDAKTAEEYGLINKVVAAHKLEQEVLRYAKGLSLLHSDGLAPAKDSIKATMEARGLGGAFRVTDEMMLLMQRREMSLDDLDFWYVRDEYGLKEAIAQRDAPYQDL